MAKAAKKTTSAKKASAKKAVVVETKKAARANEKAAKKIAAKSEATPVVELERKLEEVAPEVVVSSTPKPYDFIEAYITHDRAPVTGQSHYFIISQTRHQTQLFHPFTLTRFEIPTIDLGHPKSIIFNEDDGMSGFSKVKLANKIEELLKRAASNNDRIPVGLTRRVIAQLRGVDAADLPEYVEVKKRAGNVDNLKKARESREIGPVGVIREMLVRTSGASRDEIIAEIVKRFPDRGEAAMRSTMSARLRDLPARDHMTMTKTNDAKRGEVFSMR